MPLFYYEALCEDQQVKKGILEAKNKEEAIQHTLFQQHTLIKLRKKRTFLFSKSMGKSQVLQISLQLSFLLDAGMPLYESLQSLEESYQGKSFHYILRNLCEEIKRGNSLSNALSQYPKQFPSFYRTMIEVGEKSGQLSSVLNQLNIMLEKQVSIRKKITASLAYPFFLFCFSFLSFTTMLVFVIPQIEETLGGENNKPLTRFVFFLSHLFVNHGILLFFSLLLLLWSTFLFFRTQKGKRVLDYLFIHFPLVKTVCIQSSVIFFSRMLATLLEGGINLLESLKTVRENMNNSYLKKEVATAVEATTNGKSLSEGMQGSILFTDIFTKLIKVGEKGGNISQILHKIANMHEEEWDKNIKMMTSLAAPLILVIMGFGIGLMMVSIFSSISDIGGLLD